MMPKGEPVTAPRDPMDDFDDYNFEEFGPSASAPCCNWWAGCEEPQCEEGLCAFHLDACERTEHADAQRQYEVSGANGSIEGGAGLKDLSADTPGDAGARACETLASPCQTSHTPSDLDSQSPEPAEFCCDEVA